jgi:hypothetical protein
MRGSEAGTKVWLPASNSSVAENPQNRIKLRQPIKFPLTVQKGRSFNGSIAQDPLMFEAITAFLIVLSVGILFAHALDAFRHWT